jgi:ribosomal protein L39E
MLIEKRCYGCKQTKSVTEYNKNSNHWSGYQSYCKQCKQQIDKEYKAHRASMITEKKCSCCQEVKPLEQFSIRTGAKDGRQGYCKECRNEIGLKYRAGKANPSIIKDEVELDNIPTDFSEYSKRCSFCQEVKSLDYFYKNKTSSDGYSSRCTLCYKHAYQLNREVANAQALKRHYEKKNKAVPDHVDTMAKNKVEYRSKSKYWETSEYKAQVKQRQDEKKARWRAVFDERRADIERLINAYEADPAESQNLIIEFHHVVRPNWKLNYGKRTELYERGARQGNYNC